MIEFTEVNGKKVHVRAASVALVRAHEKGTELVSLVGPVIVTELEGEVLQRLAYEKPPTYTAPSPDEKPTKEKPTHGSGGASSLGGAGSGSR